MAITALLLLAFAPSTWTVDDDGPADFAQISDAIAAVSPGDVLIVEPGFYGHITLDKDLSILGRAGGPRPLVIGESLVDGADTFTLAGLEFWTLRVEGAAGRARIDDCEVSGTALPGGTFVGGALEIAESSQVVVTRCTITGNDGFDFPQNDCEQGVVVEDSVVQLVDCMLEGGEGPVDLFTGLSGCHGVEARGASQVGVAGCTILGGPSGCGSFGCDVGGDGVHVDFGEASAVNVRGSSGHLVSGGSGDSMGFALYGRGVEWSGVTPVGGVVGATEVDPPEPYLYVRGGSGPGETKRLSFFGPHDGEALVVVALEPSVFSLPGFDGGFFWFDLPSLLQAVALTTVGQDLPTNLLWTVPGNPALVGVVAIVQGLTVELGSYYVTNPANMVVGS